MTDITEDKVKDVAEKLYNSSYVTKTGIIVGTTGYKSTLYIANNPLDDFDSHAISLTKEDLKELQILQQVLVAERTRRDGDLLTQGVTYEVSRLGKEENKYGF